MVITTLGIVTVIKQNKNKIPYSIPCLKLIKLTWNKKKEKQHKFDFFEH